MEEAYSELYQQFLRLQSLCLRQAALLHQLTKALQKNQGPHETYKKPSGATVTNGELSDMMSIPVQCSQEVSVCLHKKPQALTATANNPAAQCGADRLSANVGTFSDVLAQDMSKLCVDEPRQREEEGNLEQKVAPLLSLDPCRWQEASSSLSKNQQQADHRSGGRMMHTVAMAVTDNPSLVGSVSQSDGMLMSDVALQSHICEFCQAIFPGDTTTRGEFLRHLYTHVT